MTAAGTSRPAGPFQGQPEHVMPPCCSGQGPPASAPVTRSAARHSPVRTLSWFSCGAASAVATKLVPESLPVYCDTGAEHPDNVRFLGDCAAWFGRSITTLKSDRYSDTWDVWEKRRYLAGIEGALCTVELKVMPRLTFQRPTDIHVFGYTADAPDVVRANRLRATYPEMTIRTPLIERGLTKQACLAMVANAGIRLPPLYALGFHNNNCLPCVKATSPDYWALMRREFPAQFERMAKLSRELGVRLCRLSGERAFIDEIPIDHPVTNPVSPACDFLCHIAEQDIAHPVPAPDGREKPPVTRSAARHSHLNPRFARSSMLIHSGARPSGGLVMGRGDPAAVSHPDPEPSFSLPSRLSGWDGQVKPPGIPCPSVRVRR